MQGSVNKGYVHHKERCRLPTKGHRRAKSKGSERLQLRYPRVTGAGSRTEQDRKKNPGKEKKSALVNNKDILQGRAWPHQLIVTFECLVCRSRPSLAGVEQPGAGCPQHWGWAMLTDSSAFPAAKPIERRVPQI